jgi:hypothetical protein
MGTLTGNTANRTQLSDKMVPRDIIVKPKVMTEEELKHLNYQQIKKLVTDKGYVFFDEKDYNLNIVFIRTSDVFTDLFTDTGYVVYKENDVEKVLIQPCSTKAGLYYVNNPITYQGVTGTAVVMDGQYRNVYQLVDSYSEWLSYPYFRQVKEMNYWRDMSKDTTLDEVQPQYNKNWGTHYHRGSNIGVTGHHIYNFSAGCLIQEEPYFKNVIELARKGVKAWGNSFSITILDAKDFK